MRVGEMVGGIRGPGGGWQGSSGTSAEGCQSGQVWLFKPAQKPLMLSLEAGTPPSQLYWEKTRKVLPIYLESGCSRPCPPPPPDWSSAMPSAGRPAQHPSHHRHPAALPDSCLPARCGLCPGWRCMEIGCEGSMAEQITMHREEPGAIGDSCATRSPSLGCTPSPPQAVE